MKLLINYDFFDAIKNVNEPFHPLKIIRNEKKRYAVMFPIYLSVSLICFQNREIDISDVIRPVLTGYSSLLSLDLIFEIMMKRLNSTNMDSYSQKSSRNLKELAILLEKINVSTNYDMLLESELYYKKTSIEPSESTFPILKVKNTSTSHHMDLMEKKKQLQSYKNILLAQKNMNYQLINPIGSIAVY